MLEAAGKCGNINAILRCHSSKWRRIWEWEVVHTSLEESPKDQEVQESGSLCFLKLLRMWLFVLIFDCSYRINQWIWIFERSIQIKFYIFWTRPRTSIDNNCLTSMYGASHTKELEVQTLHDFHWNSCLRSMHKQVTFSLTARQSDILHFLLIKHYTGSIFYRTFEVELFKNHLRRICCKFFRMIAPLSIFLS